MDISGSKAARGLIGAQIVWKHLTFKPKCFPGKTYVLQSPGVFEVLGFKIQEFCCLTGFSWPTCRASLRRVALFQNMVLSGGNQNELYDPFRIDISEDRYLTPEGQKSKVADFSHISNEHRF